MNLSKVVYFPLVQILFCCKGGSMTSKFFVSKQKLAVKKFSSLKYYHLMNVVLMLGSHVSSLIIGILSLHNKQGNASLWHTRNNGTADENTTGLRCVWRNLKTPLENKSALESVKHKEFQCSICNCASEVGTFCPPFVFFSSCDTGEPLSSLMKGQGNGGRDSTEANLSYSLIHVGKF